MVGFLGSLAAACGSNSGKTDGGGNGSGCLALGAVCDRIEACEPGAMAIFGFTDSASCKSYEVAQCNQELAAPHSGLTASLAQQCGQAIAGMSCAVYLSEAPAAAACLPHGGTVANGSSCSTPWQCASGRCSAETLNQCGACVAAIPLNQPCDDNNFLGSVCADNLVCAGTTPTAATRICTNPVAMGGACAETAVCPTDGYCNLTTNVCTKLPTIGQACDPNAVIYCDLTQTATMCDGTTSTCEAVPPPDGGCSADADGGGTCNGLLSVGSPCNAQYNYCTIGTACVGGVCSLCDGTSAGSVSAAIVDRRPPLRLRRSPAGWMPGMTR
jgi:hypothetical protein